MKRIELTGIIITGVLIVLRLSFGTFFNVSLMIMLVLLSIYYLWFGFFLFNNVTHDQLLSRDGKKNFNIFNISTSIIMGVVYSFVIISIMFAIFFYSNMNLMLGFSFFIIFLSLVFSAFYDKYYHIDRKYLSQFYIRSAAYGIICLFLLLTPVEKRAEVLFHDHPEFIEAFKDYRKNPDDPEAKEELRKQRNRFR